MAKTKNTLKLKQYSSNKAIYAQSLLNHKVLITNKEKIFSSILEKYISVNKTNHVECQLLDFYNDKSLKYNTLQYLFVQNKFKPSKNLNFIKKNTTQLSIEYSIESGLYSLKNTTK
jgi:hypothetical protein